jgi:hypothetical protein
VALHFSDGEALSADDGSICTMRIFVSGGEGGAKMRMKEIKCVGWGLGLDGIVISTCSSGELSGDTT